MIGLGGKYRHQVVVNTKDHQTFQGVYWGGKGKVVLLRHASIVMNGEPTPVDGEVVIERSNVSFYQRLL